VCRVHFKSTEKLEQSSQGIKQAHKQKIMELDGNDFAA
jgi:hypothetical protein